MEFEKDLKDIENQAKERQVVVKQQEDSSVAVKNAVNNSVQESLKSAVEKNKEKFESLADNALQTELEIKNNEVQGRKEVTKSNIRKNVTQAKIDEDEKKSERAKTILKAQGLTSQLPTLYRSTALVIGYPFYVLYLLSFGWIIQFLTFTIKGFITMVADCAERFADVNKKFVDNDNTKEFHLGKAMVNILMWTLIIGALITVVVLLILNK